jgi:hypothetical protein
MDRDRLAKLRKTKADAKAKQHQELIDSHKSVKEAIVELHKVINGKAAFNDEQIVEQLKLLAGNMTFKDEIAKLETAIVNKAKEPIELKNIEQLINAANPRTVVNAINSMAVKLEANSSQKADDFIPYRRVIKVGKRFVFDDDKMNVNVMGGGGGSSSVQIPLVRDTDDGQAIAVVNPDGSNIGGGGSGGGLTDTELRATPVPTTINNTLVPEQHDEIQATYPTTSSEVYTYKLSGVSVAVVTVTYTSDDKQTLTSVVRT